MIRNIILSFIFSFVSLFVFAQKFNPDGPYLLFDNNSYRYIAVDTAGNIINKQINHQFKKENIEVFSHDKKYSFRVLVSSKIAKTPTISNTKSKILVISDPHGEFESFRTTLLNNGVINDKFNWTFGKNQLVIIGDIFDRGDDATTILWLVYKLEKEAAAKGGAVSYLLGNHDDMILRGDDRYLTKKYPALADTLKIAHKDLYSNNTMFGKWLRSKNIIQKINDYIIVHAGLGKEFVDRNLSFEHINSTVEQWLGRSKKELESKGGDIEFIYRTYGPIWYRGMANDEEKNRPIDQKNVEDILERYDADKIILGHTIFDDITLRYDGKVVMVNVSNKKNRESGKGMGILIDGDDLYRVFSARKPEKLEQ